MKETGAPSSVARLRRQRLTLLRARSSSAGTPLLITSITWQMRPSRPICIMTGTLPSQALLRAVTG